MNRTTTTRTGPVPARTALAGLLLMSLLAAPTWSGAATDARDSRAQIEARYQADRRACHEGIGGQDRTTCLREAGAARAEALRAMLGNGESAEQRDRNAIERCKVHRDPSDRNACELMARGEGQEEGSVEGGGVIRELTIRADEDAAPAASRP